ncbi:TonB family protein [Novosphingobium sp. KACC 22771]|uniref:TonB family protein n=1 Tax=Novosphingobium sp. KACC 22771 TaxID=3025670 RepID=UPI002365E373|nr:TonB family protein [Novosphingobium sp. KACC 22771]WDF72006.1 TonB family protein [Novosphingobium sp. KACC 22771]
MEPSSPRTRLGAAVLAGGVQLVVLLALLGLGRGVDGLRNGAAGAMASIDFTLPPPPSSPPPKPQSSPQAAAPKGAAGEKAVPRAVVAPKAVVALRPVVAPPVASTGAAQSSGASTGAGTGAASSGEGGGTGGSGMGQGGGGPAVKIAGTIAARDYPREGAAARLGDYVIVAITVGADGRPTACRVHRPSRDPAADALTCRMAMERFRFNPARDGAGRAVESVFGWKQSWFL